MRGAIIVTLAALAVACSGATPLAEEPAPTPLVIYVTPEPVAAPTPEVVYITPDPASLPTPLVVIEYVPIEVTPAPAPQPTPEPTPPPTATPAAGYGKLTSRQWAQLVKAPDNYVGDRYQVWACITQFDAATGTDAFRGDASFKRLRYWYEGDNALFSGTSAQLAEFVQDDIVQMNVTVTGSFTYETQIGGSTTVPLFEVDTISRKGGC
jgi:hypothetical protein